MYIRPVIIPTAPRQGKTFASNHNGDENGVGKWERGCHVILFVTSLGSRSYNTVCGSYTYPERPSLLELPILGTLHGCRTAPLSTEVCLLPCTI